MSVWLPRVLHCYMVQNKLKSCVADRFARLTRCIPPLYVYIYFHAHSSPSLQTCTHRETNTDSLNHRWLSCSSGLQLRQESLRREKWWPYFCHPSYERCWVFLLVFFVFTVALRIRNQMDLTFLPMSYKQFKMGKGGVKQTEQMLWNGKSDHFTSHLFCLPIYCCKAGVQRSRCLAKHEGAVPLSLWGWFSLLSLLMHRHDSCLISWSC